jgi:hypothetical protein
VLYKKQGNDYLMLDPWPHPTESGQEVLFMPRYSNGKSPKNTITAVVMYECLTSGGSTIPTPPAAPPVATGVYIQVLEVVPAGLRLRSQPSTDSATLAIEPPLARLEVIDPDDVPKIGVVNKWIRARNSQGLEGYVAAWFVGKAPAPVPVSSTGPTTSPAPTPPAPSTPAPATPAQPVPPVKTVPEKLIVVVNSGVGNSGLRLRKAPSMAGALVAVEKSGTKLTVLEPANSALAKVGTQQWLNVRDPKGRRGFVIGQFVALA